MPNVCQSSGNLGYHTCNHVSVVTMPRFCAPMLIASSSATRMAFGTPQIMDAQNRNLSLPMSVGNRPYPEAWDPI